MFAFSEAEEANETCQWLGKLESCYDPSKYYKDTETNSCVHEIYTTTIGYDTGTVFPIQVNGRTVRALLDTGAEWSCMNLDTYDKLKINCLNTSFVPTLKGATGHDMLARGIMIIWFHNKWTYIHKLLYSVYKNEQTYHLGQRLYHTEHHHSRIGPGMVPKSYA